MPGAARFSKSLPDGPPLFLTDCAVFFGTARPTAASDGISVRGRRDRLDADHLDAGGANAGLATPEGPDWET